MSESPKVDLLFQYTRARDGVYSGTVTVLETGETASARPPLHTVVTRPEWVKFVVDTIRNHPQTRSVSFLLARPEWKGGRRYDSEHQVKLDSRTVEQIQDGSLTAEDLLL
jgi:hypothetical protein